MVNIKVIHMYRFRFRCNTVNNKHHLNIHIKPFQTMSDIFFKLKKTHIFHMIIWKLLTEILIVKNS